MSCAKYRKKICRDPPLFDSISTIIVFVSAFVRVSTVWSVSCLLFFYSRCTVVKVGNTCPRAIYELWSRRHWLRVSDAQIDKMREKLNDRDGAWTLSRPRPLTSCSCGPTRSVNFATHYRWDLSSTVLPPRSSVWPTASTAPSQPRVPVESSSASSNYTLLPIFTQSATNTKASCFAYTVRHTRVIILHVYVNNANILISDRNL